MLRRGRWGSGCCSRGRGSRWRCEQSTSHPSQSAAKDGAPELFGGSVESGEWLVLIRLDLSEGLLEEGGEGLGWEDEGFSKTFDCGSGGGAGGVSWRGRPDTRGDGASVVFEEQGWVRGRGGVGAGGSEAVADGAGSGSVGGLGRGADVCAGGAAAGGP